MAPAVRVARSRPSRRRSSSGPTTAALNNLAVAQYASGRQREARDTARQAPSWRAIRAWAASRATFAVIWATATEPRSTCNALDVALAVLADDPGTPARTTAPPSCSADRPGRGRAGARAKPCASPGGARLRLHPGAPGRRIRAPGRSRGRAGPCRRQARPARGPAPTGRHGRVAARATAGCGRGTGGRARHRARRPGRDRPVRTRAGAGRRWAPAPGLASTAHQALPVPTPPSTWSSSAGRRAGRGSSAGTAACATSRSACRARRLPTEDLLADPTPAITGFERAARGRRATSRRCHPDRAHPFLGTIPARWTLNCRC